MAMSLTIPNVIVLDPGVWRAKLPPDDLRFLGGNATRLGPVSVLLLLDAASFDRTSSTLSFSPTNARVLNLGSTDSAVILESPTSTPYAQQAAPTAPQAEQAVG